MANVVKTSADFSNGDLSRVSFVNKLLQEHIIVAVEFNVALVVKGVRIRIAWLVG